MDWSAVPSLASLRAFEAAARLGSHSAAARELNVTHAAIAQHVRKLEDRFGCVLLERRGGGMAATDAGAALSAGLRDGFSAIAEACRDLDARETARPLRISLTPSFAANWLMPRIGDFWTRHPGIELDLTPSPDVADLRTGGFDMAVRYGRGPWPGLRAERLIDAAHAVIAAPGLVAGPVDDLSGLHRHVLLTERNNVEELHWAELHGLRMDRVRVIGFDSLSMVIEAVRARHGIGMVPRIIAEGEIARGTLEVLFEESSPSVAYHMVRREGSESPALRTFRGWLRQQARPSLLGRPPMG